MMRAKEWLQYGEWMDGEQQQQKKINVNKDTEIVIICLLWVTNYYKLVVLRVSKVHKLNS